jgi:hypothetical protein
MKRRDFLSGLTATAALVGSAPAGIDHLPLSTTFRGASRFARIVQQAQAEGWVRLEMGARVERFGRALLGVPYVGYTLEIDDKIESPSANCDGLDCWTFFEIALGMARMIERKPNNHLPGDLLREIQWTRYRAGQCTGNYLERIHYLNEWFIDNEARGNVREVSRSFAGAIPLHGRESREMTKLWRSYRYLKNNPELRTPMAQIEAKVNALPISFIPKNSVAAIEDKLAPGDIAGIVTHEQGGVCSHVGLITHDARGRAMFMHASKNFKKVTIENTISEYLNTYKSHAGLIVARPLPLRQEVRDRATYQRNLRRLGA